MIKTFKHGDETQISPHFKASEFQCKCGAGHDFQLDTDLVDKLEKPEEAPAEEPKKAPAKRTRKKATSEAPKAEEAKGEAEA